MHKMRFQKMAIMGKLWECVRSAAASHQPKRGEMTLWSPQICALITPWFCFSRGHGLPLFPWKTWPRMVTHSPVWKKGGGDGKERPGGGGELRRDMDELRQVAFSREHLRRIKRATIRSVSHIRRRPGVTLQFHAKSQWKKYKIHV